MVYLLAVERTGFWGWWIRLVQLLHGGRFRRVVHVGLAHGPTGAKLYDPALEVIEAIPRGVVRRSAWDSVMDYVPRRNVRVWLVPCTAAAVSLVAWMRAERRVGKKYDWDGAICAGLDLVDRWLPAFRTRNDNAWFCSELVAEAFGEEAPGEATPSEVCAWPVWDWKNARLEYDGREGLYR